MDEATAAGLEVLDPGTRSRVSKTFAALEERGFHPLFAADHKAALQTILGLIPAGARVAHGTSTTLGQIGLIDALKQAGSPYHYLNSEWLAENDARKRLQLRGRLSLESDYFLGSVQAICETGQVIGTDASGSRQAFYVFGPPHVIWVAGINKLVPSLEEGLRRIYEVALPQEDRRVKSTGGAGSFVGKIVIYERERPGRISLVLIGEDLGF